MADKPRIGIIVGTYSTIFIASPLYATLRIGEPDIKKRDDRKRADRDRDADAAAASVIAS